MDYIPSTVVIGDDGQLRITRGYYKEGPVKITDDIVIVGAHGEPVISPGEIK